MKRLPPLSEMERIEQTLLVEKLDEILERIDNEDIGFVITGSGLPDICLLYTSSRDIRRIKNQEMAAYHLRSVHVSCLYYIYSLNGVTSFIKAGGYKEDVSLDFSDFQFIERLKRVTKNFIVLNIECSHLHPTKFLPT